MSDYYVKLPPSGASGVSTIDNISGAVTLVPGTGVSITDNSPSSGDILISMTGSGGGTVTSTSVVSANGFAGAVANPTTTPAITLSTSVNGILHGNGTAVAAAIAANFPTLNQNTTGTAANITASSNSTLTTLSALSLPTSQLSGDISLTSQVSGILPASSGGSPPVTRNLYVDKGRTDSFTPDGSFGRPFATIGAAISQIITNADNSSNPYTINIVPGAYSETLTFNSSLLYNIVLASTTGAAGNLENISVQGVTSTLNNTQLANLVFDGITVNGNVDLTGDINNTNFGSTQVLFSNCQFNLGSGTFVLNNVNNVNFYGAVIAGAGSIATFTNVAFAYLEGAEGFQDSTTLHLVQNNSGNQPSQSSGNYLLMSETKFYGTMTIDLDSELDSLLSYFGSGSAITNNGTLHSWGANWGNSSALVLNNGSVWRNRGDILLTPPTVNSGAVIQNQDYVYMVGGVFGTSAVAATNAAIVTKDGHTKSSQTTAPTTTVNANAGTGATCTVANATDQAGSVTLTTTATSPSSGAQATINFNLPYNVAPIVQLTPANANAAQLAVSSGVYVTTSTSAITINFAVADAAGHAYKWYYNVIETQ